MPASPFPNPVPPYRTPWPAVWNYNNLPSFAPPVPPDSSYPHWDATNQGTWDDGVTRWDQPRPNR